jgi:hypothetical protein
MIPSEASMSPDTKAQTYWAMRDLVFILERHLETLVYSRDSFEQPEFKKMHEYVKSSGFDAISNSIIFAKAEANAAA